MRRSALYASVAGAVALGIGLGAAWAAQTYTDAKYGYRVTFPDGWIVAADKDAPGSVFGGAGFDSGDRRICVFLVEESKETSNLTQSEINAQMRVPFGDAFWRTDAGSSLKNASVVRSGVREHPSSLVAQEAELAYTGGADDQRPMRMGVLIMAAPGNLYSIGCTAETGVYETYKTEIRTIVDSFRHKPGLDAGLNPKPSDGAAVTMAAQKTLGATIAPLVARTAETLKSKLK